MSNNVQLIVNIVRLNDRHKMMSFDVIGTLLADEPRFRLSTREGTIFEEDIQDAIRWTRNILECNIDTGTTLEFVVRYY